MFVRNCRNSREAYLELIKKVLTEGKPVGPRGLKTLELTNIAIECENPRERLCSFRHGGSHPVYPYVEGLWMLLGEDSPTRLIHYNRFASQFVNPNTGLLDGAYGPRLAPQMLKVYELLKKDSLSRRAVINIYNWQQDSNINSLDVPCTIMFHFLKRDGRLNLNVYIRSNDLIKGFPNDTCEFQWFQEILAGWLGCEVGTYTHIAGSMHIYEKDLKIASELLTYAPSPEEDLYRKVQPLDLRMPFHQWEKVLHWLDHVEAYTRMKPQDYLEPEWYDDPQLCDILGPYRPILLGIQAFNLIKAGYHEEAKELLKDPKCDIQFILKDRIIEGE